MDSINASPSVDVVECGDMNVDLLKNTAQTKSLNKHLHRNVLEHVITNPIRVTSNSMTLIDHIYINSNNLYSHRGCIGPGLSDHDMILLPENISNHHI